jgi:Na+/proline symporter
LGLGDVIALDFMERIFAARTGRIASRSCYWGAAFTIIVGIAASFMGMMALTLIPGGIEDPRTVLPTLAIRGVPFVFGLFIMGGIIGAGLSTADGGILGISTVFGRNIVQRNLILRPWARKGATSTHAKDTEEQKKLSDRRLLVISRLMAIPAVGAAIWLAYVKPEPGILLVLAFDVVFAGCLVPLTLGLFWKKANRYGALAAVIIGSVLRLILYFTIPLELAGLDTLIPPVVSLIVMVPVSLATQKVDPPRHHVVNEVPSDEVVLAAEA